MRFPFRQRPYGCPCPCAASVKSQAPGFGSANLPLMIFSRILKSEAMLRRRLHRQRGGHAWMMKFLRVAIKLQTLLSKSMCLVLQGTACVAAEDEQKHAGTRSFTAKGIAATPTQTEGRCYTVVQILLQWLIDHIDRGHCAGNGV
jgi:hypothetical protein